MLPSEDLKVDSKTEIKPGVINRLKDLLKDFFEEDVT